jgi:hypothetical protein
MQGQDETMEKDTSSTSRASIEAEPRRDSRRVKNLLHKVLGGIHDDDGSKEEGTWPTA